VKLINSIVFSSLLLNFSVLQASAIDAGKIVSVGDGDTIRLSRGSEILTIRLACIDAPEMSQKPYGEQAKARLQQLLPVGKTIEYRPITLDRYGRWVAEIFDGNNNVNQTLVTEGHAVVYRQYLGDCSEQKNYLQAEKKAMDNKLNFWNQSNPVMPWDYRHGERNNNATVSEPSHKNCDSSYPDVCIPSYPPDLDCGEVSSSQIRVTGNDPHGFDGDNDGIGCE
jgi:micrococcal nuclease